MNTHSAVLLVSLAVALSALVGGFAAGLGVVGANHGAEDADYSVEPMDDRSPGATNVKYGQLVVGQTGEDFRTLESMKAVYEAGSWAGCGPGDSDVFGIDRGDTHDGYEIDEELQDNIKTFSAGEDVFEVEFYGEDDFGSSTHLDSGDEVVSVASCIDNPDEPGWYQISGSTTGVTEDGERKTVGGESHYFWVCDCEDEQEAREELGPPPSEPEPTETPDETTSDETTSDETATDDDGSEDGGSEADTTEGDDADGGTATEGGSTEENPADDSTEENPADDSTEENPSPAEADDDTATPEPTDALGAAGDGGSGGSTQSADSGDQASSWEDHRVETPTPGDGDGFGGLVALGAFLGVASLFYRRE